MIMLADKPRTTKQQAWIEAILQGCNPTEAARQAKYKNDHKHQGWLNTTKDHLTQEITKRRADIVAVTGMTVDRMHKQYDEDRAFAKENRQPSACISASVATARLYGMDKDSDADHEPKRESTPQERAAALVAAKAYTDALTKHVDSKVIEPETP